MVKVDSSGGGVSGGGPYASFAQQGARCRQAESHDATSQAEQKICPNRRDVPVIVPKRAIYTPSVPGRRPTSAVSVYQVSGAGAVCNASSFTTEMRPLYNLYRPDVDRNTSCAAPPPPDDVLAKLLVTTGPKVAAAALGVCTQWRLVRMSGDLDIILTQHR